MNNKNIISAANDMTLKLKVLAKEEKESSRLKLAVTAKEKERVRNKLESNRACRNGLWAWNVKI